MVDIIGAFPTSIAMTDRGVQEIAEATVYAASDLGRTTPLAITDLQGVPITGGKLTTTTGQFPQFKGPPGVLQVVVESGGKLTLLTDLSIYAVASQESAKAAADGAASAAESARAADASAKLALEAASGAGFGTVFGDLVIAYDATGNVSSVTEAGVTTTFTYNANGTVNTDTRLGKTRTYAYDLNGNLTHITVVGEDVTPGDPGPTNPDPTDPTDPNGPTGGFDNGFDTGF